MIVVRERVRFRAVEWLAVKRLESPEDSVMSLGTL
jgi:hypothetical protein